MVEIWKDIPGYEGHYQASTLGRIKSLRRTVPGRFPTLSVRERILLPVKKKTGYLYVSPCKGNKPVSTRLHRLIAQTFIPNPQGKPQVNHINGNKQDNRVVNLEWATVSENGIHACRVLGMGVGANNKNSKPVLNTQVGVYYNSLREATTALGYGDYKQISSVVSGRRKGSVPLVYV